MLPKELFGVVVRTIGLLSLIASVLTFIEMFALSSGHCLILALVFALIGISLMLGGATVAEVVYRFDLTVKDDGE